MKKDTKKLKKIKNKKKKKSKTIKILRNVPLDSGAAVDSDWWDSFWNKNSSIPGFNFSFLFFSYGLIDQFLHSHLY